MEDERSVVNIILVVLLFGTLLASLALYPVFSRYGRKNADSEALAHGTSGMNRWVVVYVYAVLFSVMAFLETPWLHALIGQNPFVWYELSHCSALLCCYCACVTSVFVHDWGAGPEASCWRGLLALVGLGTGSYRCWRSRGCLPTAAQQPSQTS
jgi:hypothetical protein